MRLWFLAAILAAWIAPALAQGISGDISAQGINSGGITAAGLSRPASSAAGCAQATTYIAALTTPSGAEITAFTNAICAMVNHGTWGLIDALYIHANTSAANAKINAAHPGTNNLVQTGTVTFLADTGFTGDGTTGFLNTGYTPSSGGGHLTLNSASYGVCILNSRTASQPYVAFGSDDAAPNQTYFEPLITGSAGGAINDMGGDSVANANTQGAWTFTRTSSTVSTIYRQGAALGGLSATSIALPAQPTYELAFNSMGTAANFSADQHAYFFFGAGLSAAQVASVFNDLGTMLAALGVTGCGGPGSAGPFFFNSTTGVDAANNCLASGSPCLTIAKLNALRYAGAADITLTGTGFTGCIALSASNVTGSSAALPVTIHGGTLTSTCGGAASGGNGPKTAAITIDSISAVINNMTIRGSGLVSGSATQYGVAVQNSSGVGNPTTIIENSDISGFSAVGATGDSGAEIFASVFAEAAGFPGACGSVTVQVLNSTLHGATNAAADDNGMNGAGGTGCNPATVTMTDQGTIVTNMGGRASIATGITGNGLLVANAGPGSSYKFDLIHDIGLNVNTCGGPAAYFMINTNGMISQFTEVYNVVPSSFSSSFCDWAGYDFDILASNSLIEYAYSHNNAGPGFLMFDAAHSNVFRYAISENDQGNQSATGANDGGGAFSTGSSGAAPFWAAYNLTFYLSAAGAGSTPPSCASFGFSGTYGNGGLFANNLCKNFAQDMFARTFNLNGNNGALAENTIKIANNNYDNAGAGTLSHATGWSPGNATYASVAAMNAATGQEANSKIIASGFTTPPSGTCTWTPSSIVTWPPTGCPAAYSTIAAGLKSAGANLASSFPTFFTAPFPTTEGVRDYYANTIPGSGGCRNMGAYGVCP